MARPLKNNADYFPHDRDMRNDPKIRALRAKFGNDGFAVWVYLLEALTDANDFEIGFSDLDVELLSADFSVEPEILKEIVAYMVRIGLIQMENSIIFCQKLRERLAPLLESRDRKRAWAENNKRPEPTTKGVLDVENPQSKVKESKVKESKEIKRDIEVVPENSNPEKPEATQPEDLDAPHPIESKLIEWAKQHKEWMKKPVTEFEIKRNELADGSITGELRRFARYYLFKARPHASNNFERSPEEFTRNGWRDWIKSIHDKRVQQPTPEKAKPDKPEIVFSEQEAYAIAYAVCGGLADCFGKKIFRLQIAKDKDAAREEANKIRKELENSNQSAAQRTGPVQLGAMV